MAGISNRIDRARKFTTSRANRSLPSAARCAIGRRMKVSVLGGRSSSRPANHGTSREAGRNGVLAAISGPARSRGSRQQSAAGSHQPYLDVAGFAADAERDFTVCLTMDGKIDAGIPEPEIGDGDLLQERRQARAAQADLVADNVELETQR